MIPASNSFIFDSYINNSNMDPNKSIVLKGTAYIGGGEYDHVYLKIPLNRLDDIDTWISEQKQAIIDAQAERAKARRDAAIQAELDQEEVDRETYKRLQEKFGVNK